MSGREVGTSTGAGRTKAGGTAGVVGTALLAEEIAVVKGLQVFNIRNGDVSTAVSMLIRPTIPTGFHWVPVGGIIPATAMSSIDVYIKSAIFQLMSHPPRNWTEAKIRKMGIVLGTCRAVLTAYYTLGDNDYIAGEVAGPYVNRTGGTDDSPTYAVMVATGDANRRYLVDNLDLTEDEKSAITAIVGCAVAILPLQGYSLMMTSHHYLSDQGGQSRKAFAVVERQFWRSTVVSPFFEADKEDVQDAMWHKAGHPVSLTIKENLACDVRVANMLKAAGCGSGAARLPALEPTLRMAGSYMTLMETVGPLFQLVGGAMETGDLPLIINTIKSWKHEGENEHSGEIIPQVIRTRAQAITWLFDVLARNAPKVAYCYGFYCALSETSSMLGGGGPPDTLKTSYSLSKLRSQSSATYTEGSLAYADYAAARAQRRAAGMFVGPKYRFETMVEALTEDV